jgi:hypothetical protein
MPFEVDEEQFSAAISAPPVVKDAPGTVLKPFNGSNRRFPVGYVVVDSDVFDLPLSLEDLKARGFVA